MAAKSKSTSAKSTDLIAQLEPYFTKQAPFQIPANGRKLIVQFLPWVTLIVGVLAVLGLLSLLALLTGLSALTMGAVGVVAAVSPMLWLPVIALGAQAVVSFMAFPLLQKRSLRGWTLLFWVDVIYFAYNVLNAIAQPSYIVGSLLGAVLGIVIGLYVLFQVKSYYK